MKTFQETESLADLMTMALDDMEAVMNNDLYEFDSDCWHQKRNDSCDVCMAGSVMANRLDADINRRLTPHDHRSFDTTCKLYAIDSARKGELRMAYQSLVYASDEREIEDMCVEGYGEFYGDDQACETIKFWRDTGIPKLRTIEETF